MFFLTIMIFLPYVAPCFLNESRYEFRLLFLKFHVTFIALNSSFQTFFSLKDMSLGMLAHHKEVEYRELACPYEEKQRIIMDNQRAHAKFNKFSLYTLKWMS